MTTTITLITGANRGLGRAATHQLASLGWTVLLGSRDLDAGKRAAAELTADADGPVDIHPIQLDVTDDASVSSAAEQVRHEFGHLDVLVNNAGISGPFVAPRETTRDDFLGAFGVNVIGPVRVTNAFLPLLDESEAPRIVMVSSGMGSVTRTSDPELVESTFPSLVYAPSKAALNMVTTQYAKDLGPRFRVNAVDPGYTATEFNHHQGTQSIDEGVEAIVTYAQTPPDGPTGGFFDRHGVVPW